MKLLIALLLLSPGFISAQIITFPIDNVSQGLISKADWDSFNAKTVFHAPELTWNDYAARPYGDEKVIAMTAYIIHFETSYEGYNARYTVTPEFDAGRSFTRTSDLSVLEHERLHFKLALLYSRLIQNAIAPYQNKPESKEPERIYDSLCAKLKKMQALYDRETDNARNKKLQAIWERNIGAELRRLNGD